MMDEQYIIMMQDTKVCSIDRKTGTVQVYNEQLIPFDIYLEYDEYADRTNNINVFDWWCSHRLLDANRKHAKEILNSLEFEYSVDEKYRANIAISYNCTSLKDFYWVRETADKNITWSKVNLFDNSLSNALVDVALQGKSLTITNKQLVTPDISTDGVFAKAWFRHKNTFYIYKGNTNNSVNKEVRASEILRKLGFKVLAYTKTKYNSEDVSVSKCFTSKNIGYVTAGELNMNYDINKDIYDYDIMNLCDYLVGNSDRHQDNWGYLFNINREIIGFAPIFDFNHAFEASEHFICLPEQLFNNHTTMLKEARHIVDKYNIKIPLLKNTDIYTEFVNNRIKLLYSN